MPSAANKRTTRRDILINRIKFKEYYFMGMAGCRRSTGFKGQPLVGNDACVNPNLVLILLTSLLAGNESKSIEHTANLGFLLVSTVGRLKAHLLFPAVRDQLRGASLFVEIKAARLGRRTVGACMKRLRGQGCLDLSLLSRLARAREWQADRHSEWIFF